MVDDKTPLSSSTELERLAVLEAAALLDTPPEETFDQFTRLASLILQVPVALVSLVDPNRQFFKSSVGLPEPWATCRETPLSHSFCQHVVSCSEVLCVPDARMHPLLQNNLAIRDLGVIAYLGVPLTTATGHTLGSFCAIDGKPRPWESRDIDIMQALAALVMEKIELRLVAKQRHSDYLQLRKLELYRQEMVQMLVHDLRNPLTSFLGGLSLLESSDDLTEPQKKYVSLAKKGGETLSQMVNGILDVSKAEAGKLDFNLAEVTPAQIVDTACEQMMPLAEKSKVRLTCEAVKAVRIRADAEKLRRVMVNLVSNAIQHTPAGGEISVLTQTEDSSDVRFSVIDTGHGIPPEAFDRIFQKFSRMQSPQGAGESTGLGLPFSQMVIEAHGGRIWVESELGQGTSFHFTLPLLPRCDLRSLNCS